MYRSSDRSLISALITARAVSALQDWLAEARARGIPSFVGMANGIERDRRAVEAALRLPWSNGLVEGHVHRVTLIKRQGDGRAKLALLRRRVLAA